MTVAVLLWSPLAAALAAVLAVDTARTVRRMLRRRRARRMIRRWDAWAAEVHRVADFRRDLHVALLSDPVQFAAWMHREAPELEDVE